MFMPVVNLYYKTDLGSESSSSLLIAAVTLCSRDEEKKKKKHTWSSAQQGQSKGQSLLHYIQDQLNLTTSFILSAYQINYNISWRSSDIVWPFMLAIPAIMVLTGRDKM